MILIAEHRYRPLLGSILLVVLVFASFFSPYAAYAGSPSSPTYIGGADSTGQTNTGGANTALGTTLGGNAVFVQGNYAYVGMVASTTPCSANAAATAGNGCEFKVFDISNPANPTYVGGGDASGSTNSGVQDLGMYGVFVSGNYAYTTWDGNNSGGGCSGTPGSARYCELKVWDISTPSTPTYIGGGDVSGNTNSGTGVNDFLNIVVLGNYAYISADSSGVTCSSTPGSAIGCELQVWDISTPSAPTYVGGGDWDGSTNSGTGSSGAVTGVSVVGNYAYTVGGSSSTACSQTPGSAIGCEIKVWDISTPSSPTYVAGRDTSGSSNGTRAQTLNGVFVSGGYLYVLSDGSATACSQSAGSAGAEACELKVFTVTTPTSPTYAAGRDASGSSDGIGNVDLFEAFVSGSYLYTVWESDSTACSQTAGSATGCELKTWDVSTPTSPTYLTGLDVSGDSSGTGALTVSAVFVSGNSLYTAGEGNITTCSQTAGSAIGCEFKVWDVTIAKTIRLLGNFRLRGGSRLY